MTLFNISKGLLQNYKNFYKNSVTFSIVKLHECNSFKIKLIILVPSENLLTMLKIYFSLD